MNIELTDQMEDEIIKVWLKENIKLSKDSSFYELDPEFWDGMREHSQWILENNWHGG
jgi:hypothetical protein